MTLSSGNSMRWTLVQLILKVLDIHIIQKHTFRNLVQFPS